MSFPVWQLDQEGLKFWLEIISGFGILIVGILTALWAYTKFILERGFLPPAQLEVDCKNIGVQANKILVEVTIRIKNLGTSALVVKNLKVDHIRYLEHTDGVDNFTLSDVFEEIQKSKKRIIGQLQKPKRERGKRNWVLESAAKTGRLRVSRSLGKELWLDKVTFNESYLNAPYYYSPDMAHKRWPFRVNPSKKQYPRTADFFRILGYDTFVQPKVEQVYTFITSLPMAATYILVKCFFNYGQYPSKSQRIIISVTRKLGLIQYSLTHATEPHTIERIFGLTEVSSKPRTIQRLDPETS
jgi:hypothetical protein